MMLQRLATGATGVKQARYRRRPTRGSEALARTCAVYTHNASVMYVRSVRPAYEFRRGFCTLVLFIVTCSVACWFLIVTCSVVCWFLYYYVGEMYVCGGARVSLPQLCVDSACQPSSLLLLVISIVDKAVHVCLGGPITLAFLSLSCSQHNSGVQPCGLHSK